MKMNIVEMTSEDFPAWMAFRQELWEENEASHLAGMEEILASEHLVAYVLKNEAGEAIGFIEGALYLEGEHPYGYVEAWYVRPEYRRQGWGNRLMDKLEHWVLHKGIQLVLSDTTPKEYPTSTGAHHKSGYKTLYDFRVFIKELGEED